MSTSLSFGHVIGAEPKPRILLAWRGDEASDIEAAARAYAPTVRLMENMHDIRPADYDILITDHISALLPHNTYHYATIAPHLFVLWFGSGYQRDIYKSDPFTITVRGIDGGPSQSLVVADQLPPEVDQLVRNSLGPHCLDQSRHWPFQLSHEISKSALLAIAVAQASDDRKPISPKPPALLPFLSTPDGGILAGSYKRSSQSEGWVLPSGTPKPHLWVEAALRHWAMNYDAIPLVGGWWEQPDWQTAPEIEAAGDLASAATRLAEVATQLQRDVDDARAHFEQTQRAAATGIRRLLESKGNALTESAADALRRLGYEVVELDSSETSDTEPKAEDLRLRDPDDSGLDPLVEVKGYDRGAKAADLAKIMRHLVRAHHAGRTPTSLWWIINHWRSLPPDQRQVLFSAEQAMLDEHGASDPPLVVIDTKDLFRAVTQVESGAMEAAKVRSSLNRALGRWEGPP